MLGFFTITEITMTKSESVPLTYEIGKVTLIDLPKTYEHGSVIEGKVSLNSICLSFMPLIHAELFHN